LKKQVSHIFRKPIVFLLVAALLYGLSFLFTPNYSRQSDLNRERKRLEEYLQRAERQFTALVQDTAFVMRLAEKTETIDEFESVINNDLGLYIFRKLPFHNRELVFWSDQKVLPPDYMHFYADGGYFEKLINGWYSCIKKTFSSGENGEEITVYGLIPVQYQYFVETGYLPNRFAHSDKAAAKIAISESETEYSIKSESGKTLFYLHPKVYEQVDGENIVAVWLRIAAALFLLLFIHFLAEKASGQYRWWSGIIILIAGLTLVRGLSYFTDFPVQLRRFELFDPKIYGSNPVNKSLGDLLINGILFCWIVLFAWAKFSRYEKEIQLQGKKRNFLAGIIAAIIIPLFTFMMAKIVRSLAADSDISFDVTDFFSLTRFSVFGFTALCIITIGYFYFTRIGVHVIALSFRPVFYPAYFIIVVTGLAYLTIKPDNPLVGFYIITLIWLVLYTWLIHVSKFQTNRLGFGIAGTLFRIFLFSVTISAIIIAANSEKEWEIRKRLAEKIDVQSDPYNESQLSISFAYMDDDFLQNNFYRFHDEQSGRVLRDSILKQSDYLNRFDPRIFVFDSLGRSLYNEEAESVNKLNTILEVRAKPTNTPHLYYYETALDKFTFILKRDVKNKDSSFAGSFFIVSNPEKYSSDALSAELFRQANQNNPEESPVYSYAIYRKGVLVSPVNKYSFFAISVNPDDMQYTREERKNNSGYSELWYRASKEKVVVIAKQRDSLIEAITLFSYIFCVFLFLVALISFVAFLLKFGGNRSEMRRLLQLNIRTQVHSTIIAVSIVSFIIIGAATISFFINRYKQNNTEKLSRTMRIMVNEMEKKLTEQQIFDDQLPIYDSVSNQDVQKLVNDVSDIHNVDVNVYDTSGNLHVTSQPIIYREGFLSKKMEPAAFYHLNRLRQVQQVQQEKLATISYMSIYAPVRNDQKRVYAYLNIPYFLSQRELNQEISNFLVTIINLNAFIFLIAGVVALFITNRITRSFSLISEKMKEVNLGKTNEEISWNRDDEIGQLVKEYNKMVNKLEDSAAALARSEREGAWREMARQVAHEIKNPLTPMKLSIQYLQKATDSNSANVKELTSHVAATLVEQIDHLSKIAADFSQFANIGNTHPEVFDLKEVINSLRDLYRTNHQVELVMNLPPDKIVIHTDRTQMNRLFTNLLQNAVEACAGKETCKIEVDAVKENGSVIVSIKDNGEGIPAEMQSKIFVPNFTTKSSGTGLGLAMCKSIVEQASGRIWFSTINGEGTVFYTELPVLN
jgi:signal transduction histidine kinase